jgi:hypothetical protein
VPTGRMTRGVYAGKKRLKGSSFPAYRHKGRAARSYVKLGVTTCQMPPNPSPVV